MTSDITDEELELEAALHVDGGTGVCAACGNTAPGGVWPCVTSRLITAYHVSRAEVARLTGELANAGMSPHYAARLPEKP